MRLFGYVLALLFFGYVPAFSAPPDVVPAAAGVQFTLTDMDPSSGDMGMEFTLDRERDVLIAMYDTTGRLVATLLKGPRGAGTHFLSWDGRDGRGKLTPSGVYFARAVVEGQTIVRRVVLLR